MTDSCENREVAFLSKNFSVHNKYKRILQQPKSEYVNHQMIVSYAHISETAVSPAMRISQEFQQNTFSAKLKHFENSE